MSGAAFLLSVTMLVLAEGADSTFVGWQFMRVIEQEGQPVVQRAADLDGDGRDELIVVNTRHARLDLYGWLPPSERAPTEAPDPNRPNELPMAPELQRDSLQLERVPHDVIVQDMDADGDVELIVLVAPPNELLIHERESDGTWRLDQRVDLLSGDPAPKHRIMLVRMVGGRPVLLVGFEEGIQEVRFGPSPSVAWLVPRQSDTRLDWWLADLDADGREDLVAWSSNVAMALRWHPGTTDGSFAAPRVLFDRPVEGACILDRGFAAPRILLLGAAGGGLLQSFRLGRDPPTAIGRRLSIAVEDGPKAVWCAVELSDGVGVLVADPARPEVRLRQLTDGGWRDGGVYPVIQNTVAMAAPMADPGCVLIWSKDASELYASRWNGKRFTFPLSWAPPRRDGTDARRKVVALGQAGSTTWWVQAQERNVELYLWKANRSEPECLVFTGFKKKADRVMWMGPDAAGRQRLVVKPEHARHLQLAAWNEEGGEVHQPGHLKGITLGQLKLMAAADAPLRAARLIEGVVQWLGDELHPVDQIMLPQGEEIASYQPVAADRGWALAEEGRILHDIGINDAGMAQVLDSVRVGSGAFLAADPRLGTVLVDAWSLHCLREGRDTTLHLEQTIDAKTGRGGEPGKATIHRVTAIDVGYGRRGQIALYDDQRHEISVMAHDGRAFTGLASWPVFEDRSYPYSYDESPVIREPRQVTSLDIDGDGFTDLAMLCHDRLLIYLARDAFAARTGGDR